MNVSEISPEAIPTSTSASNIEPELRISVKWAIAILGVLGLLLIFLGDAQPDPAYRMNVLYFAVLFYAVAAVAWLLDSWRPWASQWFMVTALVAMVYLGNRWLDIPGFLTLMVVPTALAAALFNLSIATVIAIGETVSLLLLQSYVVPGNDRAVIAIALAAIWATLGVVYAVYHPVRQLNAWLWEYSQRAQSLLEETRDHKSELKQALDDLMHVTQQLALANERMASLRAIAEEALKTKAEFVAKVSHEFRTPLNIIIGLIDLLVETPEVYDQELPSALLEDLEIVRRNCEHLSSMVNDVLDLSRAEAGRLTIHKEHVNLAEIIHGTLTVIQPVLERKNLDLQVTIPDNLPTVYCDRTRIRQVVLNLVSNAAHFTEEGKVSIHVTEQEQQLVVSVSDTGPGISSEDAKRIFEPFCQGKRRLWQDRSGTGLGLSISKQFVKLHGGRIWLESELGRGTTFFFSLPICPPIGHDVKPGHWVRKDWTWAGHRSRTDLSIQPPKPRLVICDRTEGLYPALVPYSDEVELINTPDLDQAIQESRKVTAHAILLNAASLDSLCALAEEAMHRAPDTPILGCTMPAVQRGVPDSDSVTRCLVKPVRYAHLAEAIREVGKPVKSVLVVNGDPDSGRLLNRLLCAYDHELEIATAPGGERALENLRCRRPDLMLLETALPDIDGWQVLQLKREDEMIKDIPVIVITTQDPASQPMVSQILLVTMGGGLLPGKLLRCSLEVPAVLFKSD